MTNFNLEPSNMLAGLFEQIAQKADQEALAEDERLKRRQLEKKLEEKGRELSQQAADLLARKGSERILHITSQVFAPDPRPVPLLVTVTETDHIPLEFNGHQIEIKVIDNLREQNDLHHRKNGMISITSTRPAIQNGQVLTEEQELFLIKDNGVVRSWLNNRATLLDMSTASALLKTADQMLPAKKPLHQVLIQDLDR